MDWAKWYCSVCNKHWMVEFPPDMTQEEANQLIAEAMECPHGEAEEIRVEA